MWRIAVAIQHFYRSLTIADDPSIRELEQVNAIVEGVIVIVLIAHAIVFLWLSKRPFTFQWPFACGVALICGSILGGVLLKFSVLASPGVHVAAIVFTVATLSHIAKFDWISLYAGALTGSAVAWYATAPTMSTLVGLFVVVPFIAYAFLGAALGRLIKKASNY